ncbi:hypothetical protein NCLIV_035820 [Neospora caninum Liverpool]|uniref:Digestive organ expansion factor-like protein n=1 Tax=Neospora caninum (strain Liverpool) TaxID=572307 RepID=F0VJ90_NEOCL|nr:hypothetical protein NCLIV_035820 [Neospora caninum Liverpool]CBZ53801.1 hypothetical protein NCLIV_035820 [Neospora caninum Liverpool]CEL67795.1 TPA: hypothetical protein BN1204_035820 [Neospora caninum Liverpool]|eukprot:XP_003883833.1 hypothetical protein NCLIV_035820 [Neospora caninum Liverpool]
MGRSSRLRGGNRSKGGAHKPKKKGKKRTQKLDVEDLYYARLAEEARIKQEKKRAKKLKQLEKETHDEEEDPSQDASQSAGRASISGLPLAQGKAKKARLSSSADAQFGVGQRPADGRPFHRRNDGGRKKMDPFSRLLSTLKPAELKEDDSTEETDSENEEESEREQPELNEEEEEEEDEEMEEEDDEEEDEGEEGEEDDGVQGIEEEEQEDDGEDDEEEEAEEDGEREEDLDEEGADAAQSIAESLARHDNSDIDGEREEDLDEGGADAAQSIAESLARHDNSDSDEEEDVESSSGSPSSSSGASSSAAAPCEDSYYRSGFLPIAGRPSPLAPFDFYWTFEESVDSEDSAVARLPTHQREMVEEKKKKTPVELLHLQAAAFLQHQDEKTKTASRRKKSTTQPSAAALLLGDAEDGDDEERSDSESESGDEKRHAATRCTRAVSREAKLLVQPTGFASYSATLPSNAADARAFSLVHSESPSRRGSALHGEGGDGLEDGFGGARQDSQARGDSARADSTGPSFVPSVSSSSACAAESSLSSADRSSSSLAGSATSYFEYILKTRVPATSFDPSVASPYGLPSSLLQSLRRLLSSRFASSPGEVPVIFRSAKMRSLFHYLSSYVDVSFPHQNDASCSALRLLYALHAAAHMWKARYRVTVHSNLIKRVANKAPEERQQLLLRMMRRQEREHTQGPVEESEDEEEREEDLAEGGDGPENGGGDGDDADAKKQKHGECSERVGDASRKQKTESQASSPTLPCSSRPLEDEGPENWLESQVRDGGYTRPRILILLPFRSAAKEVVDYLIALMPGIQQVLNRRRYEEEFGISREDEREQEQNFAKGKKPEDFVNIFKGNDNDRFRLGIRVAQKSLVLYSPFYASDILVASPLGLRMIVGVPGEDKREFDFLSSLEMVIIDRADVISMQNWAFLKECLAAVNLPPVSYTSFDIRRLRPSLMAGVGASDRQTLIFSHGRDPKIQGLFKQFCSNRRGLLHLFDPEQAVFAASVLPCCFLGSGKEKGKQSRKKRGAAGEDKVVRVCRSTPSWEILLREEENSHDDSSGVAREGGGNPNAKPAEGEGQKKPVLWKSVVARVGMTGAQQFFCKVACSQFAKSNGCLLKHFAVRVLPTLQGEFDRALIVLPSYLDYCRLWRSLKEQNVDFASCHEYTSNQNITRARQRFHKGEVPILVTTVRFLFYRRYRLQGADRILFLGPPSSPEVYLHLLTHSLPDEEVANKKRVSGPTAEVQSEEPAMAEADYFRKTGASMCFFTQYHGYAMERLLGVQKAFTLLQIPDGKVVAVK